MVQPPASDEEQQHQHPPPVQQWVGMQYPEASASAAAMQQQLMGSMPRLPGQYGSGYFPYVAMPLSLPPVYCQYAPPILAVGGMGAHSGEENSTIWVGDLQYWMDENYLYSCFGLIGELVSIKVIRNKQTGQSEGYGFVEFSSRAAAEKVLQTFNGHPMPNAEHPFRLNWASFSMGDKRSDATSNHSIFVGDLAPDVTDTLLHDTFSSKYPSVKSAKVVIDASTGRSKGYGFVRFGDDSEKTNAMTEMNGVCCSSRPMRIGVATPRKSNGFCSNVSSAQVSQSDEDSTNTTIFVGGLDPRVSEDELRENFSQYGDIAKVKIPAGKQCGFVQFVHRSNAEEALQSLNGTLIGKQVVRLSWGRNTANKQSRAGRRSPWIGSCYSPQIYCGYGLAIPHDSMMYFAPYGSYPIVYNQQQVS